MTKKRHYKYIVLFFAILNAWAFNCSDVQAQDDMATLLLKCLNTAKLPPAKDETIAASVIKQANFDAQQLSTVDLNHVGCGPLSQENIFHLTCGNALFTPKKDIVVLTALAKISIGSGSAVCILKPEAGIISVYNLHSGNGKKVSLEIGGQTFVLFSGIHATICYEGSDYATINPAKGIACRKLVLRDLPHRISLYSTEFSIPSAIAHITSLRKMLSSNDKDEQKLVEQLLKNSVILGHRCTDSQPYTVASEPQSTQLSTIGPYLQLSEDLVHHSNLQ